MTSALGSLEALDLLDWKRRVFALYAGVREQGDPRLAWDVWRRERDILFARHPQTPLPDARRAAFGGLAYYAYDPALRVSARVAALDGALEQLDTGGRAPIGFRRIARAEFELAATPCALDLFWLDAYGGGLFLPFGDATNGAQTYGGGRYLLDTVKGADLGRAPDGGLLLDFNFAYNPSCSYDDAWVCPLAPAANRLDLPIAGGERAPAAP